MAGAEADGDRSFKTGVNTDGFRWFCRHPGDKFQGDLGVGRPGTGVFSLNCEGGGTGDFFPLRGSPEILWIPG